MRTHLIAIAALVGGSLALNAQTSQKPQPQQQRPTETRGGDTTQRAGQGKNATAQMVTVIGCLKEEKEVAGRGANPGDANRGTVGHNYVLTGVKMAQGSATSGIGLATTYDIAGIADAELQKHLNHQVEITGTLSRGDAQGNRGASAAPGSAAAANADLPQLTGTTMKMVSTTCAAAQ